MPSVTISIYMTNKEYDKYYPLRREYNHKIKELLFKELKKVN